MAQDEEEDHGEIGDCPTRVNPLLLLNAISEEKKVQSKGLMYVAVKINGREILAMLDTGATNNFLAERVANVLGLDLTASSSRLKAVNSGALPVKGVATNTLQIGDWQGVCNLMVVPLDDFDLILGMEFFSVARAMVMPYHQGVLVGEPGSMCFVQAVCSRPNSGKLCELSAKQLKMGVKRGDSTYVAAMVEIKPDVVV